VVDLSSIPTQPWALLDEHQAAAVCGRRVKGFRSDRLQGRGVPYVKLNGTQIRYRLGDVLAWIEQQPKFGGATTTNDAGAAVCVKRGIGRKKKA
jgi:hypothetical protein